MLNFMKPRIIPGKKLIFIILSFPVNSLPGYKICPIFAKAKVAVEFAFIHTPRGFPVFALRPDGISILNIGLEEELQVSITSLKNPLTSEFKPVPSIASTKIL